MKLSSFALLLLITVAVIAESQSPYAGEQRRQIKSLSDSDVQAYLHGNGLGYAKPAELNQYPGPKHVLELAGELELSEKQITETNRLFEAMNLEARQFGAQFVAREQELDLRFAQQSITAAELGQALEDIAAIEAKIRFAHLNAHLKQKSLLSEEQIRTYVQIRGYSRDHSGHKH